MSFQGGSNPSQTPSRPTFVSQTRHCNILTSSSSMDSMDTAFAPPCDIARNISSPGVNDSSLSRAGLLQATNYVFSHNSVSGPRSYNVPHSQDDIRSHTLQLSSILLSPKSIPSMLLPPMASSDRLEATSDGASYVTSSSSSSWSNSVDRTLFMSSHEFGSVTPRGAHPASALNPSGLSILLSNQRSPPDEPSSSNGSSAISTPTMNTPVTRSNHLPPIKHTDQNATYPSQPERHASTAIEHSVSGHLSSPTETSALLRDVEARATSYSASVHPGPTSKGTSRIIIKFSSCFRIDPKHVLVTSIRSLPAVALGVLLNILDGVSYGLIIFPTTGIFADLGGIGVSMFFLSTVISQLVYSAGGSSFVGANGSMMIEVVPFFHIIATSLAREIGEDRPREVIATTLVAFAFSSILTGLSFFVLGALRLGALIGFFPRHILIGCIGGVGVFLIITGLAVSTRLEEEAFNFSIRIFRYLFLDAHNLVLWLPSLALAVLLRIITHKFHHQLIFPIYFMVIPVIFYAVVLIGKLNLNDLREAGWIFTTGDSREPWYMFYTMLRFESVQWGPFWKTLPTQFALLFFNILHPPLNVPALSVSLNEDVDTDKELVAHGYSNLLAGFLGTVPNYLVYVNTLLFYRAGGGTRIAGFLLAAATALLLFIGTGPISYVPVVVVGALIFVLGIDLVKEALWDTRYRVNRLEYVTIVSIMVFMTAFDFVVGVLFGIVVSCFFFVVQNSQQNSIRALHTGDAALSTVRRPSAHRAYLREVSKQTTIVRLQGFLFFGTITHVEESIRTLVDGPSWLQNPFRFLVIDLLLVYGVDMSAAEAFVRLQRILSSKDIVLVFCSLTSESMVGRSLHNAGLFDTEGVELFSTHNDAIEWIENVYLRAWFSSCKEGSGSLVLPGRQDIDVMDSMLMGSSPRGAHLHDVGWRMFGEGEISISPPSPVIKDSPEPLNTLSKVFSSDPEFDKERFFAMTPYLEKVSLPTGMTLWRQGDESDALYIIESGVLRASYRFADHIPITEESMVAGTLAGELSGLSGLQRNATVVVERQAVVWKLSRESLKRLEEENPQLSLCFTKLVMRVAKIDYDILLSALATK